MVDYREDSECRDSDLPKHRGAWFRSIPFHPTLSMWKRLCITVTVFYVPKGRGEIGVHDIQSVNNISPIDNAWQLTRRHSLAKPEGIYAQLGIPSPESQLKRYKDTVEALRQSLLSIVIARPQNLHSDCDGKQIF